MRGLRLGLLGWWRGDGRVWRCGEVCAARLKKKGDFVHRYVALCCSVYLSPACRLYLYPLHPSTRSNSIEPLATTIIRTITRWPWDFRRCPFRKFISRQLLIRRRLQCIRWRDYTPLAPEPSLPTSLHRIPSLTRRQDDSFPHSLTATLSRSPHPFWPIIF